MKRALPFMIPKTFKLDLEKSLMLSTLRESIRRMQSTSMRSGDSRSLKRHDRQFFDVACALTTI